MGSGSVGSGGLPGSPTVTKVSISSPVAVLAETRAQSRAMISLFIVPHIGGILVPSLFRARGLSRQESVGTFYSLGRRVPF